MSQNDELLIEMDGFCIYGYLDGDGPKLLLSDDLDNPTFAMEIDGLKLNTLATMIIMLFNRYYISKRRQGESTNLRFCARWRADCDCDNPLNEDCKDRIEIGS